MTHLSGTVLLLCVVVVRPRNSQISTPAPRLLLNVIFDCPPPSTITLGMILVVHCPRLPALIHANLLVDFLTVGRQQSLCTVINTQRRTIAKLHAQQIKCLNCMRAATTKRLFIVMRTAGTRKAGTSRDKQAPVNAVCCSSFNHNLTTTDPDRTFKMQSAAIAPWRMVVRQRMHTPQ